MKQFKAVWLSLAACILALSLLTACGGMEYPASSPGGSSSGSGNTGSSGSSGSSSDSSSASDKTDEPEKDPNENQEAYRKEVLRLINVARAEQGLDPLGIANEGLTELAQSHAESMPKTYRYCNEVIWKYCETPEQLVRAMRQDYKPGGTEPSNIYRTDITQIGIGFYYNKDWETNGNGRYYWDIIVGDMYYPINTTEQRASYRQEVLDELNKVRSAEKLPLLTLSTSLTEAAQMFTDKVAEEPSSGIRYFYRSGESVPPQELAQIVASKYQTYLSNSAYNVVGVGITTSTTDVFASYVYFILDRDTSVGGSGSTVTPGGSGNQDGEDAGSLDKVSEKTEIYRQEVLRLINIERQKNGVAPLTMSSINLTKAAQRRANELAVKYDRNHLRPDGRECFTVLPEYNVSYHTAGENIAEGQVSPAEVVNDWMNSPGHRQNILNPDFHKIGIGVYCDPTTGRYEWVQVFTD